MHEILQTLRALKLFGMAQAFETQINQPTTYDDFTFLDRLQLLIQQEMTCRDQRRLTRLLKQANFKVNAHLSEIDYNPKRKLTRQQVASIQSLDWFHKHRNIILTGATGSGKTYLACAIGQLLCQAGYTTRYYRASRLFEASTMAHADGSYGKFVSMLAKTDLLLIDDWGLEPLTTSHQHDLLEVLEDRHNAKATIIASQLPVNKWHQYICYFGRRYIGSHCTQCIPIRFGG